VAKKATEIQIQQRIECCMRLLSKGLRKGEIKSAMCKRFGISASSAEKTYLPRARKELLKRLDRSRGEIKAESLAFYESVLSNTKATQRDKIIARKRIDQLLGLDEPRRLEHTGADGGPIKTETIHDVMSKVLSDPEAHEAASRLGARLNGSLSGRHDADRN